MTDCRHVAIIMDGNGRWAKKRNMPRSAGHMAGAENVHTIAIAADKLGIEYLTLYAFSTENWKRSQAEVSYLMKLPSYFFKKYMQEFIDRGFQIHMIGELDALPEATAKVLREAEEESSMNHGLSLNIAMNYGSHREILLAAQKYAEDVKNGKADPELDEAGFEKYLMTRNMPPVDLLIRTGAEMRISNFLLWQIAYAELEFVDVAWPDFSEQDLKNCLDEFAHRHRRFGGVENE